MLLRPGSLRAVDRVADRERQHAADQRGDEPDLHGVADRAQRQRIVEQPLEMDERVLLHVEQALDVADEQELAEGRDDQRQRRQHHHDEEIDDREREREIAPAPELHHAGPERLAGDRDVAAPAHHPLLQPNQEAGDDHQDDRDRGGGRIERRRPVGELEDVGRQHRDVARRAEHRRNAVDAEHHDERQQHAGDDRRRDQRERHREQDAHRAGAGDFGGLLERRIHVAQRRRREHVDVGRVVDAEDRRSCPRIE